MLNFKSPDYDTIKQTIFISYPSKTTESKVAVAILVSEILKCGKVSASIEIEPKLTVVSYNIIK